LREVGADLAEDAVEETHLVAGDLGLGGDTVFDDRVDQLEFVVVDADSGGAKREGVHVCD